MAGSRKGIGESEPGAESARLKQAAKPPKAALATGQPERASTPPAGPFPTFIAADWLRSRSQAAVVSVGRSAKSDDRKRPLIQPPAREAESNAGNDVGGARRQAPMSHVDGGAIFGYPRKGRIQHGMPRASGWSSETSGSSNGVGRRGRNSRARVGRRWRSGIPTSPVKRERRQEGQEGLRSRKDRAQVRSDLAAAESEEAQT